MRMTYYERNILVKISNRLSAKMEEITSLLPLLCYALDSTIFSDEDYESVKDVDFLSEMQEYDNAPGYFLGALLLFIRNFYEHSDNRNVWVCGLEQSTQHQRSKFISFIRKKCRAWINNCFPQHGFDSIRKWVRSQSWVLKAEIGGEAADILDNNTKLYNSLVNNFGAMPLMDKPENIDEWKLPQELEECQYVGYLFEHHKWTLMQSLYAIAADSDLPDNLPNWLKPMWGLKRNTIREKGCKIKSKVNLIMAYNHSYYPALELFDWDKSRCIKQKNKIYTPRTNLIPLHDLVKRGFKIEENLVVEDANTELNVSLKRFFESEFNVFRPQKRHRLWNGIKKYSKIDESENSFSRCLLVVHRGNQQPSLLYGAVDCKRIKTEKIVESDLSCSEFEIKPLPVETSMVSIHGEPLFEMRNPTDFNLDVSEIEVETGADNRYLVIVGKSTTAFSRVPVNPDYCSDIDFEKSGSEWKIVVHDNALFKPLNIIFRNEIAVIEKKLVFVPETFFDDYKAKLDFSDGNEGFWKLEYKNLRFRGPLESAEWCWDGDTSQMMIEGPEANHRKLCVYGAASNLKLEVDGRVVWTYCSGKSPTELLSCFDPGLKPGKFYCLKINETEAYRGRYHPQDSCFIESDNRISIYSPDRRCTVRVRHELYYKNFFDFQARSTWERVYDGGQFEWKNNCAEICAGYTQFPVDGHVLIILDDKKYLEKTYKGTRSLRERWGSVDACACRQAFDIPHETKFYEDLENGSKLIGNAASYEELLQKELIRNATELRIPKPSRTGGDFVLMNNGFFRPDYCLHCSDYSVYLRGCRKTKAWGECIEIITAYAEGNKVPSVARVSRFCSSWVADSVPSLSSNEKQQLCNLWSDIKSRMITRESSWLCKLGEDLMKSKQYISLVYLCAAVILCFPEQIPLISKRLRNQDFVLDRVSRYGDILRKFVLLVRCALTLS